MPKTAWNRTPIDRGWLKRAYLRNRLPISQIARKLGVSGKVVHNRLREYGIPIRSVSEAKTQFHLTQKELEELYFRKQWSMFQIADFYGCSHGIIVHRFKKFGLRSRGQLGLTPPISISKKELKRLYYNENFSLKQIAKRLGRSKGGVERRLSRYGIKTRGNKHRKHWKYEKKPFDGSREEKAYMIGFRLGDLNVTKTNQVVVVRGSTTKPAQAELIKQLFKPHGGVKTARALRGTIEQYAFLDRSFDFMLPKQDAIEPWINSCPRCFLAFFSGYFDAEGCVLLRKSKSGDFGGFEIQTYDKNIIFQSWNNFHQLCVDCPQPSLSKPAGYINSNGVRNNCDSWRLSIYAKASVWRLINFMKYFMKHQDKALRLRQLEQNIIERNISRKGGKIINLAVPSIPLHSHTTHIR